MTEEEEILTLNLLDYNSPEEALFNCALKLSEVSGICVICLIKQLSSDVQEMLKQRIIYHGMEPQEYYDRQNKLPN